MIGLYYKHSPPFLSQNMTENIFYSISTVINDMSISSASFIYLIYLLAGDDLKNKHKPYIVAIVYLLSSHFIIQNHSFFAFYSAWLQWSLDAFGFPATS